MLHLHPRTARARVAVARDLCAAGSGSVPTLPWGAACDAAGTFLTGVPPSPCKRPRHLTGHCSVSASCLPTLGGQEQGLWASPFFLNDPHSLGKFNQCQSFNTYDLYAARFSREREPTGNMLNRVYLHKEIDFKELANAVGGDQQARDVDRR